MKKYSLLLALAVVFALSSCAEKTAEPTEEETEEVSNEEATINESEEETTIAGTYGDQDMTAEGAISTDAMLVRFEDGDSVQAKVRGKVADVCQRKGCWMDMALDELGNESMTIKFKDYEFFVPMNCQGRTAIVEGYAKMEVQTVEWLQHKASDAGASEEEIAAITEPKRSVTFMASGVIIE